MEAPLDTAVSIAKTPDGFAIGPLYIFVFVQIFSLQEDRTSQRWLLQSTIILIDLQNFTRNETYKSIAASLGGTYEETCNWPDLNFSLPFLKSSQV